MYQFTVHALKIIFLIAFCNQVFAIIDLKALSDFYRTHPIAAYNAAMKPISPYQSIYKRQIEGEDAGPSGDNDPVFDKESNTPGPEPEPEPEPQPIYPNMYPMGPGLKPFINPNETEEEKAERIHKTFEKLLTFVEIVGQVDNYVSSKFKSLVKTVSNLYEDGDEGGDNEYRVGGPRGRKKCGGRG